MLKSKLTLKWGFRLKRRSSQTPRWRRYRETLGRSLMRR
jgi:hypothetical protein